MPAYDPETANVMASADDASRYALLDADGVVQNVCLWDGNLDTWQPPADLTAHPIGDGDNLHPVGIGWTLADGHWTPGVIETDPTPQPLTVSDPAAFQEALGRAMAATTTTGKLNAVIALLSNLA